MRLTAIWAATAALSAAVGVVGTMAVTATGPFARTGPAAEAGAGGAPGGPAGVVPLDLFLRRWQGIDPEMKIDIGPARPSAVAGLEALPVTLSRNGQTQQVELLRSRDGRYLIAGLLLDLTTDPHAALAGRLDLAGRPSLGRADAPVTVVEYSDFQCPFCRQMAPVVHRTMQGPLGKDVRWVFKHLPLASIHPWAEPAAVAAECARSVGGDEKFWALHDHYFEQQEAFTVKNHRERTVAWARGAGLPAEAFERCLGDQAPLERVRADAAEARAIGVSSTPTLVINGRLQPGAVPAEPLAAILEQELAYQRARERARPAGR